LTQAEGRRPTLSLPPSAWLLLLGAAVVLLAMLSLLALQLGVLKDSQRHIAATDRKVTRVMRGAQPVIDDAKPVVGSIGDLVDAVAPVVRGARPLVAALRRLDPVGIGASITVAGSLAERLAAGDRLVRVVDQSSALLEALGQAGFVGRTLRAADLVPYMARVLRLSLGVQRVTLETQRRTLAIQDRSLRVQLRTLAIQREALRHIRSIDRKTGGPVPPPVP
jgi:hypothetical protein